MQVIEPKPGLENDVRKMVLRKRVNRDIAELDYKRAVKRALVTLSQVDLARSLGITQPSVSSVAKSARAVPELRQGFSGATPMEICQRYNIGELDKDQLIDELTRWDYSDSAQVDSYDSLLVDSTGTFREVERAAIIGLIEEDVYEEVLSRLAERR